METEHDYQMISQRQGAKPSESRNRSDAVGSEEGGGQTLDLAWLMAVVRRRALVMATAAIALSAMAGSYIVWKAKQTDPIYEGSFRVLVEPVTAEGRLARLSLLAQAGNSTGASEVSKLGIENSDLLDYQTQIQVLTSPKLMAPVVKELQARYPDLSYESLIRQLEISRVSYQKDGKEQGTKILGVIYRDTDPQEIRFVLERLADTYLKYSLQERQTSLRQGLKFIDEQLPDLQKQVDILQAKLQKLRQDYTLNEPDATGKSLTEQAQYLRSQRIDLEAQLAQAQAAYTTRQRLLVEGNITSVLAGEPNKPQTYDNLIGELQKVETEIALQSSQFKEDSPPMLDLREKQQNLSTLLTQEAQKSLDNVAGQIEELQARDRTLAQAESVITEKIRVFPQVLREYTDLDRELQIKTESLKQFLAKKEAYNLDVSQRNTPWEMIAQPELMHDKSGKPLPVSEKQTKRQLAIAGILSLLMGIGIGFVVEILHTVFHTPDEIKAATRLRLLGVIPLAKELKKLEKKSKKLAPASLGLVSSHTLLPFSGQAQDTQATSFLEAFRSLYTNIRLLSSRKPIHSLVIGSAVAGDGKSTVAVHLAQTAAAIGQRVLLVDADLRRPQLHFRLGLPNEKGLSDVIETDLSLNDAIQQSPVEENLFVMTAGQATSDSIKLLSSAKMQYLMEQFQAFFDLVIYDTPPLLGLADGNILAANTDGIVLVVGLEKTDRSILTKSMEGLKISGATVLGVVANGIKGYASDAYTQEHRQYQTIER
jgi:capsular exopolysaccharide synthesis family protein